MENKDLAKSNEEFDQRFEQGEDVQDLLDMSQAKISCPGTKVRITFDIAESLIKEIDRIRERIGVDRGELIKVWLYERVRQEAKEENNS